MCVFLLLTESISITSHDCCHLQATKNKQEVAFYSIPEFDEWKKQTENYKNWHIKYYKGLNRISEDLSNSGCMWDSHGFVCTGLGTSTSKEAKEYFAEMEKHRITFRYSGAEDDAAITLVSTPTHADCDQMFNTQITRIEETHTVTLYKNSQRKNKTLVPADTTVSNTPLLFICPSAGGRTQIAAFCQILTIDHVSIPFVNHRQLLTCGMSSGLQ